MPLRAAGLRPQWLISVSSMCFWDQSKPCQSCSNNIFDLDTFESFECLASPSNLALWSPLQKAPAVQKGGKESQNLDVSESVHLKHIQYTHRACLLMIQSPAVASSDGVPYNWACISNPFGTRFLKSKLNICINSV